MQTKKDSFAVLCFWVADPLQFRCFVKCKAMWFGFGENRIFGWSTMRSSCSLISNSIKQMSMPLLANAPPPLPIFVLVSGSVLTVQDNSDVSKFTCVSACASSSPLVSCQCQREKNAMGIGLLGALETFYMVVDMEKGDLFKSTLVQSICSELPYQYLGLARVFIAEHMQRDARKK